MEKIEISIVCAYYNRKKLFLRTLESIKKQLKNTETSIEVIAVDDGSDESERLEDLIHSFPFLKIIRLEKKDKWYTNSCIPFNIGFNNVSGNIVIIQNPECLHYGNIIEKALEIKKNEYFSFACYSLGIDSTDNIEKYLQNESALKELIAQNNEGYIGDGLDCWYNHPIIRPCAYHFCNAIRKEDLEKLGGFDERFAYGVAYDDNEFLHRIKMLGLTIKIIGTDIVLHQNHYLKPSAYNNVSLMDKKMLKKRNKLVEKNKNLFENVIQKSNDYKARKIIHEEKETYSFLKKIFNFYRSK